MREKHSCSTISVYRISSLHQSAQLTSNNINNNVLFIDLSTTKAVSNIFLTQNPLPEKTIIDLVNIWNTSHNNKDLTSLSSVYDENVFYYGINKEKSKYSDINTMAKEREDFYKNLKTFEFFGKGWLRRNEETREAALAMVI